MTNSVLLDNHFIHYFISLHGCVSIDPYLAERTEAAKSIRGIAQGPVLNFVF